MSNKNCKSPEITPMIFMIAYEMIYNTTNTLKSFASCSGDTHTGGGCCCHHRSVAWEMGSKLALDASKRGHSQTEASDVVGVGRQQTDLRLGMGSEP